jgi:hypothetical protein
MSTHTDTFNKIAFLIKKAEEEPNHGLLTDALLTGAGVKGMDVFAPMAGGKVRYFHGASPDRYTQILNEGILTTEDALNQGKSVTGDIIKQLGGDTWDKSKNMAFVGNEPVARLFAARSATGKTPPLDIRFAGAYGPYAKTYLKNLLKTFVQGPVSVEIPYDEVSRRVKVTPEYKHILRQIGVGEIPIIRRLRRKSPLVRALTAVYRNTKGIVGGVKPSEIRYGKGYNPISLSGIKANPLRAGSGLLGLLASAGLTGYGITDAAKNIKRWGPQSQPQE